MFRYFQFYFTAVIAETVAGANNSYSFEIKVITSATYTDDGTLKKSKKNKKIQQEVERQVKEQLYFTVLDDKGNPTGITVKSVKATKPKNGIVKVTIVLKGSNKAEKKAVKAMNKKLKKISVAVET